MEVVGNKGAKGEVGVSIGCSVRCSGYRKKLPSGLELVRALSTDAGMGAEQFRVSFFNNYLLFT